MNKYDIRHDCDWLFMAVSALIESVPHERIPKHIYNKSLELIELLGKEVRSGYCIRIYKDKKGDFLEEVTAPHFNAVGHATSEN